MIIIMIYEEVYILNGNLIKKKLIKNYANY